MNNNNIILLFISVFLIGIACFTLIFYLSADKPKPENTPSDIQMEANLEKPVDYQLNETEKMDNGISIQQETLTLVFPNDYMLKENEIPQTYIDGAKTFPPIFVKGSQDDVDWWWGQRVGLPTSWVSEIYFVDYYGFNSGEEEELAGFFIKFVSPATLTENLAELIAAFRKEPGPTPTFMFKDNVHIIAFIESRGDNTSTLQSNLSSYSQRLGLERISI